jgi:hypothetical protein
MCRALAARDSCVLALSDVLHKVVEFDLPARRAVTIRLSGAASERVSVLITGPA